MMIDKTFGKRSLDYNQYLSEIDIDLPKGFKLINPYCGPRKEHVNEIAKMINEMIKDIVKA